jgi:hypothetical protein
LSKHQSQLNQQAVLIVILLSLEFNAYADMQNVDSSSANQTPAPLVVMPPISSGNAHQATSPKTDKNNSAKAKKPSTDKKKQTVVKAGAGSKANAEKNKEAETVAFLKTNQECDSWFDLDGNTSDATAYQQIKNSGYTKSNAPAAVKNQIVMGVAKCNQKYLIARPINQTTPDTSKSLIETNKSEQNENNGRPVSFFSKVANGVTQFFSNFRDGNNNSNNSKHTCSPGELLMHFNEC